MRPVSAGVFARVFALWLVAATLPVGAAAAQAATPCDAVFPEQDWLAVDQPGDVATFRTDVDEGLADRFAAAAESVASLIAADFGTFPGATLCLFGGATGLDTTQLVESGLHPAGQQLHAARFLEEKLLFVDTQQIRLVEDAISLGVANIALWHLAPDSLGSGYPEPLASAVAQWYVARHNGNLEYDHARMRIGIFYSDPRGNAAPNNWLVGSQEPVVAWNPLFQQSSIGDFVESAVAAGGVEMLRSPRADVWMAAEAEWRAALRDELLQGADESGAWVWGAVIAASVVAAAIGLALWNRSRRRRPQLPMGDIAKVEGFFDNVGPDPAEPVPAPTGRPGDDGT